MNKCILIGRLGFDPDSIQGGCRLKLAVDTFDGKTKRAVWLTVLVFGASGQNVLRCKNKGDKILVEGRIDVRQDNTVCIISDEVTFL